MDEETAAWRTILEGNIKEWRSQLRLKYFDKRSKERMLAVATAGQMKLAQFKSKKFADPNAIARETILEELINVAYGIEMTEGLIADAEIELASLGTAELVASEVPVPSE